MESTHYASVNGIEMFYREVGEGHPIIFLHGSMGTGEVWRPYIDAFSSRFRVIVPDQRGHGKTAYNGETITLETLVDDIAALITHLELDNPTVVGWSMGGNITLQLGYRYPERVGKLLIGGATLRASESYQQALIQMGYSTDGTPDFDRLTRTIPDLIQTWEAVHQLHDNHWQTLLGQLAGDMFNPEEPAVEAMVRITAPTLVLWGDRDEFLDVDDGMFLYNLLPDAQLAVVPNADHWLTRTHIPMVLAMIRPFLEDTTHLS